MSRPAIPESSVIGDAFARLHGPNIAIFVDGNEVRYVVSYDIPGGEVVKLMEREGGGFEVDLKAGVVRTETLKGKVAVCWAEPERMFG